MAMDEGLENRDATLFSAKKKNKDPALFARKG
jgi:hypothetical protein